VSKAPSQTVSQAIRDAAAQLEGISDTARLDAELLMAHALGCIRSHMLLRAMQDDAPAAFTDLLERRMGHEPIAYIVGSQSFFGHELSVNRAVLIPRGDSEQVVEAALRAHSDPRRICDLGTGSGALLLSLLAERPAAGGVGVDRSPDALRVAFDNAARMDLAERASFVEADWTKPGWSGGLGRFDLVIANPPYVERDAALDRQVRDYEPAGALFAGEDGLDDYRILIPQLPALLEEGGIAVLEIGAVQGAAVANLAQSAGFACSIRPDLAGRDRVAILSLPAEEGA
jgi:release factor glutamine methyltransferase